MTAARTMAPARLALAMMLLAAGASAMSSASSTMMLEAELMAHVTGARRFELAPTPHRLARHEPHAEHSRRSLAAVALSVCTSRQRVVILSWLRYKCHDYDLQLLRRSRRRERQSARASRPSARTRTPASSSSR